MYRGPNIILFLSSGTWVGLWGSIPLSHRHGHESASAHALGIRYEVSAILESSQLLITSHPQNVCLEVPGCKLHNGQMSGILGYISDALAWDQQAPASKVSIAENSEISCFFLSALTSYNVAFQSTAFSKPAPS